jgi:sugar O-acyltransferase (sialic acid O-acetyltransferase NeuD family)
MSSRREVASDIDAEQIGSYCRPRIVLVGCSGHARVILDILEEEDRCDIAGLLDTYKPPGTELRGYKVLGSHRDLPALMVADECDAVIVAIGDNWVRGQISNSIKDLVPQVRFMTTIHPSAQIAKDVTIGDGTVIMAGAMVTTGCHIGESCILNTGASLDHDSMMGGFSSLAPRVVTGGNVNIGAFSAIGIGAIISHAIEIGEHTVVGAGATVIRDIPARVVAHGTPARTTHVRKPGDSYLEKRPK